MPQATEPRHSSDESDALKGVTLLRTTPMLHDPVNGMAEEGKGYDTSLADSLEN